MNELRVRDLSFSITEGFSQGGDLREQAGDEEFHHLVLRVSAPASAEVLFKWFEIFFSFSPSFWVVSRRCRSPFLMSLDVV